MSRRLFLVALAFALPAQADGPKLPPDPVYRSECGSCHVPYPPKLLPRSSWRQLMDNLGRHFGGDASVDAKTEAHLREFLALHAGRRAAPPGPEPRITRTPWFLKEHRDEIPAGRNPADCLACHERANDGFYDDD